MTAWMQSSRISAGTIAAELRPSRWVAAATLLMLAAAIFAVLASGLLWPWRIALASLALVYGLHALHRFMRPRIVGVGFDGTQWTLADVQGRRHMVQVRAWRPIGPLLVVDFRWPQRKGFICLLAPDNCPAAQRREWLLALARSGSG